MQAIRYEIDLRQNIRLQFNMQRDRRESGSHTHTPKKFQATFKEEGWRRHMWLACVMYNIYARVECAELDFQSTAAYSRRMFSL